jgi:hypothetical protein
VVKGTIKEAMKNGMHVVRWKIMHVTYWDSMRNQIQFQFHPRALELLSDSPGYYIQILHATTSTYLARGCHRRVKKM